MKKLLLWGAVGFGLYMLAKKQQVALPAPATTPTTNVSPTNAATTANMSALAGLTVPPYPVPVIYSGQ